jgi:hypothetical protein
MTVGHQRACHTLPAPNWLTLMSDYIHKDDVYEWLPDKEIQFAEDDFAKVQAERDALKAKVLELHTEVERLSRELARGL